MNLRTKKEHALARKVAFAGAVVMALFCLATFISPIVTYLAYRQVGISETYPGSWWLRSMLDGILTFISFCSLTRFLLLFSSGSRSDVHELSNSLLISGVAMLAKQACSYKLKPLTETILIVTEPIPIGIIPDYDAPVRMFPIAFFILLLCVAALIRYMDALREDSESIV